jgi:hypothetical protein
VTQHRARLDAKRLSSHRRPGPIPGRRSALALALAAALVACSGGVAWGDTNSGQQVIALISRSGQQTQDSVSVGTLVANCTPLYGGPLIEYKLPDGTPVGNATQYAKASTWSVSTVLGCLQNPIPVSTVQGITILRGSGDPDLSANAQLTPDDLKPSNDFADASESPIIDDDGTSLIYQRPWRGPGDSNDGDEVDADATTPFEMEVFEGPKIPDITVSVSPSTTVPVNSTVTFMASDPNNDSGVTYTWYVSDEQFATGPTAKLPFDSAGKFDIYVQATDAAGGSGPGNVQITVTSNTPTTPPTSATPNPNGSPTSTRPGTGIQPGKTPSPGTVTPSPGKHGKTPASNHRHRGKKATGHTKTTPSTPASTVASGSSGHGGGSGSSSNNKATNPSTRHATTPVKGTSKSATSGNLHTALVSGRLLSAVTPVAPSASPLVHVVPASVATAPQLRRAAPASILPGVAGGLGFVLLLVLGAGRELRRHAPAVLRFGG